MVVVVACSESLAGRERSDQDSTRTGRRLSHSRYISTRTAPGS